jgi:hypothetical protein
MRSALAAVPSILSIPSGSEALVVQTVRTAFQQYDVTKVGAHFALARLLDDVQKHGCCGSLKNFLRKYPDVCTESMAKRLKSIHAA